ncbi:MAG: geranylgeranyl reductase family protein [Methanobrevibacter sp.]|nr:geranylgeranyl reductase family protein [Methanobrevibacter sp.]
MSFDFDVAIVGGGPIGSTLAYEISKKGFSVGIFDKKKEIGIPLQCAGIVSKKLKELNEIPNDLILNKVKGAFLHSPNHILKVEKNKTEAFVIDRIAYDKFLAKRAIANGVKFFTKYEVNYVDIEKGVLGFKNGKKINAKVIVGADGSNSIVSRSFNKDFNYFHGSQFLVKLIKYNNENELERNNSYGDDDFVDLFINTKTLPGFLWSIPSSNDRYRVGLFSKNSYKEQNSLIEDFLKNNERFENYEIIEKHHGKIPIYDEKKQLVNKRVILIGDAASQLKPTTGGGLILGFEIVQIAKTYIEKSLNEDNIAILNKYGEIFRKKYSKELKYQLKVQKTLEKLSDKDLDYLFFKLKEKGMEKFISKYGDMDKQSILVKEILKKGLIFSILPSIVFNQVSKIWNLK